MVGTSLILEGGIVGAAVAGYALVDSVNPRPSRLARQAGVPFRPLGHRATAAAGSGAPPRLARRTAAGARRHGAAGEFPDAAIRRNGRAIDGRGRGKDEFLAVLSHELRSPLTPILGWAACSSLETHRLRSPARWRYRAQRIASTQAGRGPARVESRPARQRDARSQGHSLPEVVRSAMRPRPRPRRKRTSQSGSWTPAGRCT